MSRNEERKRRWLPAREISWACCSWRRWEAAAAVGTGGWGRGHRWAGCSCACGAPRSWPGRGASPRPRGVYPDGPRDPWFPGVWPSWAGKAAWARARGSPRGIWTGGSSPSPRPRRRAWWSPGAWTWSRWGLAWSKHCRPTAWLCGPWGCLPRRRGSRRQTSAARAGSRKGAAGSRGGCSSAGAGSCPPRPLQRRLFLLRLGPPPWRLFRTGSRGNDHLRKRSELHGGVFYNRSCLSTPLSSVLTICQNKREKKIHWSPRVYL